MVLLLLQHTRLPTPMWRLIICPRDWMLPEWHVLPQVAQAAFHLWGLPEVDLLASSYPLNASIITPWNLHYLWGLGVECLQSCLDVSGKLCVSSFCISSSGSVQVSGRTYQRSTQMFDSGGTMLDGGSLALHSSQHVSRPSLVVLCHKRSHHGCLGRPGAQGSAISAFNPLAAQQCVLQRQEFSSSVCQALAGASQASMSKVYQQCWKEWAVWCAQQDAPNNAISAPKLANFLVYLFPGWPGLTYNWYISSCYFCFFGASLYSQGF